MISPSSGLSNPPVTFNKADLPEPDYPSKKTNPLAGN
jgi:hypothetical protein